MGMSAQTAPSDAEDGGYRPMAEINITPMVDVMLVLLIIFMVAAPLMVSGVPVQLPKTSAAKVAPTRKPMVVTMTADGRLQIRNDFVAREELIPRLASIKAAEGDGIVYVRGDSKLPYGEVMKVLGEVGQAGFSRVSLLSNRLQSQAGQTPPAGQN
ncbi:MAG TPA: ExbD/TolR family protein [Hyphomicrobium sp.]|nr:ExbD/TolR family protein [Hyphomicrobium sp.]